MKYKIILFDADETLFDFKKSEETALENTLLSLGCPYDKKYYLSLYKSINDKMWIDLEKGKISADKLKVERFRQYLRVLNLQLDPLEVSNLYEKELSEASFSYEESLSVVKYLHKNFRLFIVTNGLAFVQRNRLKKSPLFPYFEDIIISEEVSVSKPDSKIFEIALEKAKFYDKKSVLMIGDSLSSDIKGGINFGIDTCWLNKDGKINNTGIIPTYEIKSLWDVKIILNKI